MGGVFRLSKKVQGAGGSSSATSVSVPGTTCARPLLRLTTAGRFALRASVHWTHTSLRRHRTPASLRPPAGCGQSPQTLCRSTFRQAQRAPKVQDVRLCTTSTRFFDKLRTASPSFFVSSMKAGHSGLLPPAIQPVQPEPFLPGRPKAAHAAQQPFFTPKADQASHHLQTCGGFLSAQKTFLSAIHAYPSFPATSAFSPSVCTERRKNIPFIPNPRPFPRGNSSAAGRHFLYCR